jgi:molecular chaperone HscA
MSKAWVTGSAIETTFPLVLGQPADGIDVLTVPSSVFITRTGHIFFGAAAERQHEAEIHLGRHRFDNIKRLLSETEPGLDLDEVPLEAGIDPTDAGLTKGDLVVLYLAWLTDMALKALESTIQELAPELLAKFSSVRAIQRRFAVPCFEHAVDDVPSSVRAVWANKVMESALARAQIIADTLSSKWRELNAIEAKAALRAVRTVDFASLDLFCRPAAIREPVAAGATRFRDYIDENDSEQARARRLMLVIDSGAGTTDFALFQSFYDSDSGEASFALISKAVGMSRVAGNRIDTVLRPLVLKACRIHPENGSPWSSEEFSIIKADLSSQIRSLKQQLFANGSISISLRPGASGVLTLKELESEVVYQELSQNLLDQRNSILRKAFSEESLEAYRAINSRMGRPVPIYVLLTGGSARLPLIKALAADSLVIGDAKFGFVPITELPRWIQELPRNLSELVAREFSQCAVAIGGSAPLLPKERGDLLSPIIPPREGVRRLERSQAGGI